MKKILVVMAVVLLVVTGCGKKEKRIEDCKNTPVSFAEQNIDGLNISGFNLNYDNGITNVLAVIKNTTKSNMYVRFVDVILYDKDGKQVGDTYFYIDKELAPGEDNVFESGFASDVTTANKVEYKVTKQ